MHQMSNEISQSLEKTLTEFNQTKNWQQPFKFQIILATLAIEALLNIAEAIRDLKR